MRQIHPDSLIDQAELKALFEQQAPRYDQHAVLEREVADRLLERVEFQKREPARIMDLGCGSGYCASTLKRRYRKAEVVGVDFALPMCQLVARKSSFMRPLRVVCANVSSLPFSSASVDLLVANLSLQWTADLPAMFNGLRRILKPGGLLLFSIPGTDSLKELKMACQAAGYEDSVREFMDMHDLGDALMAAGFREPVMAAEIITLAYRDQSALLEEVLAVGAASYCRDFDRIQSKAAEIAACYPVDTQAGTWPLSWEIVYGAAFGPEEGQPVRHGGIETATFSVDALRASRGR